MSRLAKTGWGEHGDKIREGKQILKQVFPLQCPWIFGGNDENLSKRRPANVRRPISPARAPRGRAVRPPRLVRTLRK